MVTPATRRATLFVRSYTPTSDPQNTAIRTARTLQLEGVFDDVDIETVPNAVRRTGTPSAIERQYEQFREWATETGYAIDQPFSVRSHENQFTGEQVDSLVLPFVCLAVYEDDELSAVLPCDGPDGHLTVLDYLDALERGVDPLDTLSIEADPEEPQLLTP